MKGYIEQATKKVVHEWGDVEYSFGMRHDYRTALCGQTMRADCIDPNVFNLPACKRCAKKQPLPGPEKP